MNEEICIKIIDVLSEKMGIIVDYSKENLIPYVKDLGERYINYTIIIDLIGIFLIIAFDAVCIYFMALYYKSYKKKKEEYAEYSSSDRYDYLYESKYEDSCAMFVMAVIFFIAGLILSLYIIMGNINELTAALIIPEKLILELLQK